MTLALSYLLSCREILQKILKQSHEPDFEEKSKQEAKNLTGILESRLQFILLQMMKCQSNDKKRYEVTVKSLLIVGSNFRGFLGSLKPQKLKSN